MFKYILSTCCSNALGERLHGGYFFHAPLVPPAFELGGKKYFQYLVYSAGPSISAQTYYVGIIMLARFPGAVSVAAYSRPDAPDFIGCNADAYAGTAY